jgi:UDP-N-acetylglucosamine--N-acetylmuramyl-(pentapeptide) pyrophosphoryl-undecaprenol N-acetylglucosamine transferase
LKKVILTTGGTGGHIYPALAVARELNKMGIKPIFVGTVHRMESDMIPQEGYEFIGLDVKPLKNISSIFKMVKSIFQSLRIVLKEKPNAIIGFGNYISVPVLLAGIMLRKKIYLQEQNANLGFANKLFYRFSKSTFLAFDKTYDDLPIKYHKKLKVMGNPLRNEIYMVNRKIEREKLKIEEDEKVLLITGGSLGSKSINDAMMSKWERTLEEKKIRIYWATGENHFEEINQKISKYKSNDVIKPYFNNMPNIMAVADLVICRAGALTISELIAMEKPSILIPYQSIKVGQYENAKILEEVGAAYVYKNSEVDVAIERALNLIKDDDQLNKIKSKLKILKKDMATEKIVKAMDIWGTV